MVSETGSGSTAVCGKSLREGIGLRLDDGACLPMRSTLGQCRACATACPKKVLAVSMESVTLADGCIECGRCVAACPTDALRLEAMEIDSTNAAMPAFFVECSRVPAELAAQRTLSVPCLGALSPGRLLQLNEECAPSGLVLIDRGCCAGCSAGGDEGPPVQRALARARDLLADSGVAAGSLPRIERKPVPSSVLLAGPRAKGTRPQPLDRRQFFRAALRNPVSGASCSGPTSQPASRAAGALHERQPSRERQRQLGAVRAAAERQGVDLPPKLFPVVSIHGICADHRSCVAVCPTAALSSRVFEDGSALVFSGEACIDCGICERACPERALRVRPEGGQGEPCELVAHRHSACTRCGTAYLVRKRATKICASCEKSERLAADAMQSLFSRGRRR